jgi:hypothetical protein
MPAHIRTMLADRLPPRSLFVSTTFPPIRSRESEGEVKASRETCPIDEKSRAQERTVTHTSRTKPYTRKCPQSHGEVPVRRLQTEGARSPKGSRALRIHASSTRLRPGRTMEHEDRPGEHRLFHPVSRKGVFPTGRAQRITTASAQFLDENAAANHDSAPRVRQRQGRSESRQRRREGRSESPRHHRDNRGIVATAAANHDGYAATDSLAPTGGL